MRFIFVFLLALPAYAQTIIGPGESHTVTARECPPVPECPASAAEPMLVGTYTGGVFYKVALPDRHYMRATGIVLDAVGRGDWVSDLIILYPGGDVFAGLPRRGAPQEVGTVQRLLRAVGMGDEPVNENGYNKITDGTYQRLELDFSDPYADALENVVDHTLYSVDQIKGKLWPDGMVPVEPEPTEAWREGKP